LKTSSVEAVKPLKLKFEYWTLPRVMLQLSKLLNEQEPVAACAEPPAMIGANSKIGARLLRKVDFMNLRREYPIVILP